MTFPCSPEHYLDNDVSKTNNFPSQWFHYSNHEKWMERRQLYMSYKIISMHQIYIKKHIESNIIYVNYLDETLHV